MDAKLQTEKLTAEIDKLKAETRALRRPFRAPSAWVPLLIGVGGVATAFGQCQQSAIKEQRAALEANRELFEVQRERATALAEKEAAEQGLQEYKTQFMDLVVRNFDVTREAAVRYYGGQEWWRVTELRRGNDEVQSLLLLMRDVGLLPVHLRDDLEALIQHYSEWLAAFAARFPDGTPEPHRPIAVGSFPQLAEQNIRRCLTSLRDGATECADQ